MTRRTRPVRTRAAGRARRRLATERGAVTAETAMVLPLLVAVTLGLVWLLSLGVAQVQTVDAARETARALARDEPEGVARDLGAQAAPDGAQIAVSSAGDRVSVTVTSQVSGPAGLFAFLPPVDVEAEAVALREKGDEP